MTPDQTERHRTVSTGYWAGFRDAAGGGRGAFRSRVHSHVNGRPLCGYRPSPKASFQHCSAGPTYAVDCPRCLALLEETP